MFFCFFSSKVVPGGLNSQYFRSSVCKLEVQRANLQLEILPTSRGQKHFSCQNDWLADLGMLDDSLVKP